MASHSSRPHLSLCFVISSPLQLFSLVLLVALAVHAAGEDRRHFHFYFHDDYTGPNPTAVKVVSGPSTTSCRGPRNFGDVVVLDNLLTEGPSADSKPVGRAQGFAVRVSRDGLVSHLSMHVVFGEGQPFNGSSIAVFGRIDMRSPVRESVVVGGTGQFRLARGSAFSRNYDYDLAAGGTVEFDLYVENDGHEAGGAE